MVKDKHTTSPDDPDNTQNIQCDQCSHPQSFHRQKKYYCQAEVMYNDPINNNEPIKAMCSCTLFANAEKEAKKKKDKEDKENQKEKDKEKQPPIDQKPGKPQKDKQESIPLPVEQPATTQQQAGGILI